MISQVVVASLLLIASVRPQTDIDSDTVDDVIEDICKTDVKAATTCLACSRLPFGMAMDIQTCCNDIDALETCTSCTRDPSKCAQEVITLENDILEHKMADNSRDTEGDEEESMDVVKRYGRIFFGTRAPPYLSKRYGRLFFGRRPGYRTWRPSLTETQKRYGKLFMSKKSSDTSDKRVDKRYGRLFMTPYLDKRYESLNIAKPYTNRYYWK